MISAKEARKLTDYSNNQKIVNVEKMVEKLCFYIKDCALQGKDSLIFCLEHVFIIKELEDLGYTVERVGRLYYKDYPLYMISW